MCHAQHRHKRNAARTKFAREVERFRLYGITKQEYEVLLRDSGNRCGICAKPFKVTPHIDHDHTSGKVRGLLCGSCNRGIGYLQDDAEILRAAILWVERDPR